PAGESGGRDRAREREPEGPLEPEREQRGGVGADAEEGGVAERELTGVTEEEVQGQRQDAEDPRHDDDVKEVRAREPERQCEREEDRHEAARPRHPIRSCFAKSPAGRSSRTRMMITNPTASRWRGGAWAAGGAAGQPTR